MKKHVGFISLHNTCFKHFLCPIKSDLCNMVQAIATPEVEANYGLPDSPGLVLLCRRTLSQQYKGYSFNGLHTRSASVKIYKMCYYRYYNV